MKLINEPIKQKKKRYSKNKKKGWRKIDISDIIEASNEINRDERLGGPVEHQNTDDLFVLDVGDAKDKDLKGEKGLAVSVGGLKPLRRLHKPLRCEQFLKGLPGAKAISKKGGIVKQKENRVIKHARKLSKGTADSEARRKIVSSQRKSDLKKKKVIPKNYNFNADLWGRKKDEIDMFDDVSKTFMKEPIDHYKAETKKIKIRTPKVRFHRTSALAPVVPPDPGASYNPRLEDHQKLLAKAVAVENARLKKAAKLDRMVKKYLPAPTDGITQEEKLAEMAEGLPLDDESSQVEEEIVKEDQKESTFVGPGIKEKKSKQTRKNTKTNRVREQKILEQKRIRQREKKVEKIKQYENELKTREKRLKMRQKRREKQKLRNMSKAKRLSKHKFQEGDVVVPLGNDLSSSLRGVNPLGNAIEDTFKNWRRRNIIDTRVRVMKPKRKTKIVYKRKVKQGAEDFVHSLLE